MRLADFILSNLEPILAEWEVFARTIRAGEKLDGLALRDHAGQILQATARDMRSAQTGAERDEKSRGQGQGGADSDALDGASDLHAVDRLGLGFDMQEVMSEYRALRASVLRLWHATTPGAADRDVDDLTRFNESIDQSLAKAVAGYTRRIDQAREMFLAILGHDLRNPLNAIAMAAYQVPLLTDDPAEALACSHQIARSVHVMERMISDLLDYTRTRLGAGMPVVPAPVDLAELGREMLNEFRATHPKRDIQYRPAGDLRGVWDEDRLRQAMSNLMGNALQHGADNFPVTLALSGTASEVSVAVHNMGVAIPPGELPRIFDPLVRGSGAGRSEGDRPGSIGMGLYIAREVAKSHGGRIAVTSTDAAGTTVTIHLPRRAAAKVGQPDPEAGHVAAM